MENQQNRKSWMILGAFALLWLTILTMVIRLGTGKYDTGYWLLLLWLAATLALPGYLLYLRGRQLTKGNKYALLFYLFLILCACLLFQPLLWAFGKVGFIPFYTYSLLALLPIEALMLLPMMKLSQPARPAPLAGFTPADLGQLGQQGLQEQAELLVRKLNRIRQELAIETDAGRKFQYEMQIEQLEKEIAELKNKLRE
jgi:hypothetical protein